MAAIAALKQRPTAVRFEFDRSPTDPAPRLKSLSTIRAVLALTCGPDLVDAPLRDTEGVS
jgi:hypothetical protein